MAMPINERHGWLGGLGVAQLQALASRWGIPGWNVKTADDLRKLLVQIEGVEVPVQA
jgi:hypothetical protein